MRSSTRMFKSNNIIGTETRTEINPVFEQKEKESIEAKAVDEISKKTREENEALIKETLSEKKKLLNEAKLEAKKIRVEAETLKAEAEKKKEEAKQIKIDARNDGLKQGQQIGYNEGYQKGYQAAFDKVEKENQKLKEQIIGTIEETKEKLVDYQLDKKDEFIQLAAHMAEKIVHHHIDTSEKEILSIAEPYLNQLSRDEEFVTISAHPSEYDFLNDNLNHLENFLPETRFVILQDPSLEERGLLIESTRYVIDLQIKKQLDTMLHEFEEMERTIDA